ncbi:MAG: S9 family peptidase [Rubrivivax sp.]
MPLDRLLPLATRAARAARVAWAAGAALVLLAAASPAGAQPSPAAAAANQDAYLPLPPGLMADGVPPVPRALAALSRSYSRFDAAALADWHPVHRELLVSRRPAQGSVSQLWRLAAPMASADRLTSAEDPTEAAHYEPLEGRYLLLQRASGGSEAWRLYRHDLPDGREVALTEPGARHQFHTWLRGTGVAVVSAVPLDAGSLDGPREDIATTFWLLDPQRPAQRRRLAELPGTGWAAVTTTPDGRTLLMQQRRSINDARLWLLELEGGALRPLLPQPGDAPASLRPVDFSPDGRALWLLSDQHGEFRELLRLDLESMQARRDTAHIPWDLDGAAISHDGSLVAIRVNADGRSELRLLEAASGREIALPPLPAGSITGAIWHPRRLELAFTVSSAQAPGQIHTLDWTAGAGPPRLEPWMRAPRVRPDAPGEARIVRWPSFDGRTISGLLHLPAARFTGPRPVLVDIHGGPESQARAGYPGRYGLLLQELGVAVLQPNVRGSSGYGKTFLKLDNGLLREDPVKDIGALLDWIARQPGLDASRVVVAGGSYGGFMSLAVASTYPERIVGAIDVVGVSDLVSFLRHTESYRRDLRRAEYGDERDPQMRAFLERISPLAHAHRITRPLLVVHGRNDPRVPWTEAEQIVRRVRANGTPVWYLLAANEGHGFRRRENQDYQFYTTVLFLKQVMGLGD